MTIRRKLTISIGLLLIVSMGALSYGIIAVSTAYAKRDAAKREEVILNSVQKAAQDALIQKDDLLLVSYIKFLRQQYPSLLYTRIEWRVGERVRSLNVGEAASQGRTAESVIQMANPTDPASRVSIQVGLDSDITSSLVAAQQLRLTKIILGVSGITILLGVLLAYWFALSFTAPLEALSRLALEIMGGKLGGKLEWKSQDEIGDLVGVFNAMSLRLEALDEAKRNFVSSVTHELRSPLGAIDSFLHLINERLSQGTPAALAQTQEYLGRIQVNVQRLGGFINDLLDVAKIEKGKMECLLKPMRLQDVALEVCQFFEAKAKQQGVALANRLSSDLPAISGDPDRLRQVLTNLVSNALKFTPSGGRVTIQAEQFREGENRWLEVAVADTGRGITAADQERLFKAFSQGRNVGDGVFGTKGTGLGLYIVKSIVEQHGGRVEVRSAPGQGTQFVFSVKVIAA
jgi:signal transduction histidine kinase